MKHNHVIWDVVLLVALATVVVSLEVVPQLQSKVSAVLASPQRVDTAPTPPDSPGSSNDNRDLSKFGIVRYDSPQPTDPKEFVKRQSIGQRYDKQEWVYKTVTPETGGVGKVTHDAVPPLLPIEESGVIVVGEVIDAKAYMSNDRGGIYTEYRIRVDNLIKNANTLEKAPEVLVADREGGVVVYPNGQRVMYQNSTIGLPLRDTKYVFFLIKDDQSPNYKILTSYDISTSEKVMPMEVGRSFKEFKDLDKTAFIEMVQNKVKRFK